MAVKDQAATLAAKRLSRLPATEVVIQPARGWAALQLGEVWAYRDLLYFMTLRDIQGRYRQMALGPLWIVVGPLLNMVLYSFVFGQVAKLPSDGVPYPIFSYVALLPWQFFAGALSATAHSLLSNKGLISKVYFPRLIPPLSRILSSLVDFVISFVILIGMLIYFRITPNFGVVLIPVFMALAALTGIAVGLWFAGIIVHYRDFGQVLGFVSRFWMYATPVVYSISLIPENLLGLYWLNPMTSVVEGFRWALLGTGQAPGWPMLISTLILIPILIGGLFHFKRVERNIVDIV